jgi:diaminohydroxyphosphoribosylaminopyrimidine deaminase/5-amino-6-(5-phosphoribosylamino)uracil reductase
MSYYLPSPLKTRERSTAQDERWMRRALSLAARVDGRAVWPNPRVGCVLVKNGRVIAEGWHRKFGGPHAEAEALKKAGAKAKGAAAYLTLEPCRSHPGKKTPPCADALKAAGVKKVVAAMRDPNPKMSGRGFDLLRRCGARVQCGLLADESSALNGPFIRRMRDRRPWIILKSALSLDGKAFARGGASRWITGPDAREAVHELRSKVDAVLVGIGTVLADDPALTAHGAGQDPLPVILDAKLRTPKRARILRGSRTPLIFTARGGELLGAEVLRAASSEGRLQLRPVLAELSKRGVGTLLVEGGPTVMESFLAAGYADEVWAFFAPKLLGGTSDPNFAPLLEKPKLSRLGSDFLFSGRLTL